MKKVVAVRPYIHPDSSNFKLAAFEAWQHIGGGVAASHYPPRCLHGAAFRWCLPQLCRSQREARLRFVEPVSIRFDTFPDYARYEVIPFVWDCWPRYFDATCRFFERNRVRTAFFTSSQTAEKMRRKFPKMNVFYIPEGINTSAYGVGLELKDRTIDLLEFGRSNDNVVRYELPEGINHVKSRQGVRLFATNDDLFRALAATKVTIVLPRLDTQPELAGGIETLTQRYWEAMLSRIVMVGRAPKELINLLGYNPVVDLDRSHPNEQMTEIVSNIATYQTLVDRNRAAALAHSDWTLRMKQVQQHLAECGYEV